MITLKELKEIKGSFLGVDFGDVRTGLAVCDPSHFLASGRECIKVKGLEAAAEAVSDYAKKEGVTAVVVGLPRNMDGSEGHRAERAKRFAEEVERLSGLPVALADERMTTMAASRYLNATDTTGKKRKGVIDTLSAEIILQNALDRMKNL